MELLHADAFERLVHGRRLVFTYPVACEKVGNSRVSVVVMDSAVDRDSGVECAAMLVPCHKERDWVYGAEGGQWQLLASAAASRFIMIFRNGILLGGGGEVREEEKEEEEAPSERPRKKKRLSRERKKVNGMRANREQEQGCRREKQKCNLENRRRVHTEKSRGFKVKVVPDRRKARNETDSKRNHETDTTDRVLRVKDSRYRDTKTQLRSNWKEDGNGCEDRILIRTGVREKNFVQFCDCENCDDEGLKKQLGPLVVALAPRSCFQAGPPVIPFVSYADNILQRIVVEEAYSTLTGAIVVEDVALTENASTSTNTRRTDDSKDSDVQFLPCADESLRGKAAQLKQFCDDEDRYSKSVRVVWRRRLQFKRMPNLIQTEVSLIFQMQPGTQTSGSVAQSNLKDLSSVHGIVHCTTQPLGCGQVDGGLHPDHSQLVHKYLAPIVAGLVLVAPALEACMELGKRVKVLALGIGGGALPIFLHKHFGFQVQAVELDEVVLDLACRHFGLIEDELMKVEVGDGIVTIDRIAMRVAHTGTVAVPLIEAWQQACCDNSAHPPTSLADLNSDFTHQGAKSVTDHTLLLDSNTLNVACKNCQRAQSGKISMLCELCDPRVHVIIVDVDEGDAKLGLSSPPSSFLQCKFLMGTKIALHSGGMLAMNVVPFGETLYQGVLAALMAVFEEVYETVVEDDVNRVVFALPSAAAAHVPLDSPLVSLIKQLVDPQLLTRIHKVGVRNTASMDPLV